jgi:hypothetical protein
MLANGRGHGLQWVPVRFARSHAALVDQTRVILDDLVDTETSLAR